MDVLVDEILAEELRHPGYDARCGVNLVCRPGPDVVQYIAYLQDELRRFEPDQYYYPASDLHLTLLEICHSRTFAEAAGLAQQLRALIGGISLERSPRLHSPKFRYDERGCALSFEVTGDALQQCRTALAEALDQLSVRIQPRYPPSNSAHVTFFRYIAPLRTAPEKWMENLQAMTEGNTLQWTLSHMWLTWGANWYGLRSRISESGPYMLEYA